MRATYSHHTEHHRGMLQLEYELKKMCREHRAGGRTTQSDRLELAATVARDLDASGYHRFSRQKSCSRKLKDKHVRGLVQHWTSVFPLTLRIGVAGVERGAGGDAAGLSGRAARGGNGGAGTGADAGVPRGAAVGVRRGAPARVSGHARGPDHADLEARIAGYGGREPPAEADLHGGEIRDG